ncbi:hypothetical protein CALVIDRAFT_394907 [Calocera viscosa TUFC12733]|uniref:NB-ARC domain-containing protein n=1 Tax=Calocera viscosa (strain TUFC12733) TaxID=1330018 RepID=A0A167GC92_CALVF|nr:hypothetical protein CALVIDRAFT_394907 [Calocera viscosa TUFC12733]
MAASSSKTPATIGEVGSSRITLPKRGLKSLRNTVDPLLAKLRDAALKVLDLTDALATNKADLKSLAQRVQEVTEDIIEQAGESPQAERLLVMEVGRVQAVIDEIVKFLARQHAQEASRLVARVTNSDVIREEIVAHKARLNEVITLLNTNLTMKMFSKMQMGNTTTGDSVDGIMAIGVPERTERDGSQEESMSNTTTPSDFSPLCLPPKPEIFHGREAVMQQLKNSLLQDEGMRIAILGSGGIGKTTMATIMIHDPDIEAKFGTRRIFLRCEAMTSADGIVSGLAAALNVAADGNNNLLRSVVQYLRDTKAPVLLVLDNFETPWDSADQDGVESVLAHLDTAKNLSFVVTMRGTKRPGCVKWSHPALTALEPVDLLTARTIYLENGGQDGDGLDNLLEALDGLPLAIVLLAYHGQNRSPAELAVAYEAERTNLLNRGRRTRLTNVEVSISFTLNCQTMRDEPDALEALRLLSLLPDGVEDAELPDVFPNLSHRRSAIRTLQDVALLSRSGSRYKMLAPIRECILIIQEPAGPFLIDMRNYYYGIACQINDWALNSQDSAMVERIREACGNICSVMMHALGRSELSHLLFRALECLYLFTQIGIYGGDRLQLVDAALAAVQGDPTFRKELYSIWIMKSAVHWDRDEQEVAAAAAAAAAANAPNALEQIEEQSGTQLEMSDSALAQPNNAYNSAQWRERNGDLEAAAHLYREARHGYEQMNAKSWAALCAEGLGRIHEGQGKLEESYELHLQARTIFLEMGRMLEATNCLFPMALSQMKRRNHAEAISLYSQAVSAFRSLGLDRLGAYSQLGLAFCYWQLNMYDQAASALTAAHVEFEKLKDRKGVVECMQLLARF